MSTPKIEKLIEAVKFFASSDDHQVRPTTKPVSLKEAKAALLDLAQQAESWKSPHEAHWRAAGAHGGDRKSKAPDGILKNGRTAKAD